MRAVVTPAPGRLELREVPLPRLAPGEIRLRVEAATVNPVDGGVLSGAYAAMITQQGPVGLGWDAAGTVSAVGADVAVSHPELVVGARVAALSGGFDKALGALADELVVPADDVALVPEGLGLIEAATVPLNSLTAYQALDLIGEPNGTLLVTGAAGAVGGYAVPLAVARGWEVVGLARESDRAFVEDAGAKLVTDLDGVTVDAVLDAAGLRERALDAVRDGGRFASVTGPLPRERSVELLVVMVQPDGARLADLLAQTASGALPVRIDRTVPLDEAAAAVARAAESGVRGRVVLTP